MEALRQFDAYAKPLDDFRIKTHSGALLSLSSLSICFFLILSEYWHWTQIQVVPELIVDQTRQERLDIHVNVSFHKIPCSALSMDVMDSSGEQQNDIHHTLFRQRLDEWGQPIRDAEKIVNFVKKEDKEKGAKTEEQVTTESGLQTGCGNCYGAGVTGECCNTCGEVRAAYARKGWAFHAEGIAQCKLEGVSDQIDLSKKEGCLMYGHFSVNKVSGNFHFAPGHSFQHQHMHVHDMQSIAGQIQDLDFKHTIHKLTFGEEYEGVYNPLNNYQREDTDITLFYQYFVKVVPTTVRYLNRTSLNTYQYSVTQYHKNNLNGAQMVSMPGVFFNYDISPMRVIYTMDRRPFTSFLTSVCAVVGGILTLAHVLDTFLYAGERALKRKIELGKNN